MYEPQEHEVFKMLVQILFLNGRTNTIINQLKWGL